MNYSKKHILLITLITLLLTTIFIAIFSALINKILNTPAPFHIEVAHNNEWIGYFGSIIGALIGGLISGAVTIYGLSITIRHNSKNEEENRKVQVTPILRCEYLKDNEENRKTLSNCENLDIQKYVLQSLANISGIPEQCDFKGYLLIENIGLGPIVKMEAFVKPISDIGNSSSYYISPLAIGDIGYIDISFLLPSKEDIRILWEEFNSRPLPMEREDAMDKLVDKVEFFKSRVGYDVAIGYTGLRDYYYSQHVILTFILEIFSSEGFDAAIEKDDYNLNFYVEGMTDPIDKNVKRITR